MCFFKDVNKTHSLPFQQRLYHRFFPLDHISKNSHQTFHLTLFLLDSRVTVDQQPMSPLSYSHIEERSTYKRKRTRIEDLII